MLKELLAFLLVVPLALAGDTLIWVDHGDGHIDNDNHGVYALRDFPEEFHQDHHDHLGIPVHQWHHGDYDDFHHGHEHEHEHDLLGEHLDWLAHGHEHEHDRHHDYPALSEDEMKEFREFQAHRHHSHDW